MYHGVGPAYSKVFFNSIDASSYFKTFDAKMESEIQKISDAEIVSCDFQEWSDYLVSKYYIAPITIFDTNIEKSLSKAKIKTENIFRGVPYEPDYYELDGVRITFTIPYDGDPALFEVRPSTYIISKFFTKRFIIPQNENCGSFALDFEYTEQELQQQGASMPAYVETNFENMFSNYRKMIDYVNREVRSYNNSLAGRALLLLNERKNKADSFSAISNALQIPLNVSKTAPNIKPINLKRIIRQPSVKPTVNPEVPEPYISNDDYDNINNIITMCGTTMEKTARTYFASTEEELRDNLLAALNTHYINASGETFRKIGKTDILIEFENKAAFIGECKIWHGESLFKEAIQQIINYSTWRDVKISVIIFNKVNRSFPTVLSKIETWANQNSISYMQPQANIWKCKYHRQDMNIDIQLTILAFDLYVDKTQFKDPRYN